MSHPIPKSLTWALALGAMLALGACGGSDSPSAQPVAQTISFTAPAGQSVGAAPLSLVATSSSGLAVSFASTTPAVCTVSGTVASLVGAGSCSVVASQAGDATYTAATPVTTSFTVAAGAQAITFLSPGNQSLNAVPAALMGTASSGLAVTFVSATPAVCTVNGSTLALVSAGTCTLTASQAGNANYLAATDVSHSFDVATGLLSQTISFAALGNQTLGTAAPPLAATATSGLAVSFASITPAVCTVNGSTLALLSAGTCTASASQGGNTVYAAATSVTISFTVATAQQVISFNSPGNQTLGTAPAALLATSSSGLPVSLASTTAGVCTVNGSTLTLVSVGTCSLDASQAGNATYAPATTVTRSFTVAAPLPIAQAISFTAPGNQTLGTAPPALVASASSGLAVSFASNTASVCTVSGNTVTLVAVGTCSITASQAGNAGFAAATPVTNSFTVAAAPLLAQTITFTSPGSQTLGTAPAPLSASASSGLVVSFASTTPGVCTVSGNTLSLVAVGTCSITASQAGNSTYSAATPVANSFAVAAAPLIAQTISFPSPGNQTLGIAPAALAASASSGLAVSFASNTPGVCTASGTTLTLVAVGTCTVTASQAGNGVFAAATPVANSFTVAAPQPTPQTISFTLPGAQTITGFTAAPETAPAALSASATSGLAVSFASTTPSVCTVNGTALLLQGVGSCTITASQGGNGTYAAATPVSVTFAVAKQLIANGGFESATAIYVTGTQPSAGQQGAGYWLTPGGAGAATLSTDSHSGGFSASVTCPQLCGSTLFGNSADNGGLTVSPANWGKTATFSFWAKGTTGTTGNLTWALRYLDGTGNILAQTLGQTLNSVNPNTWTKFGTTLLIPNGTVGVFFETTFAIGPVGIQNGQLFTGGGFLIDDILLVP